MPPWQRSADMEKPNRLIKRGELYPVYKVCTRSTRRTRSLRSTDPFALRVSPVVEVQIRMIVDLDYIIDIAMDDITDHKPFYLIPINTEAILMEIIRRIKVQINIYTITPFVTFMIIMKSKMDFSTSFTKS